MATRMNDSHGQAGLRIVGSMYILEVRAGLVHVDVGAATNLTLTQGADAARSLRDDLLQVLELTNQFIRGLIMDVRKAPSIAGPKTRAAMGECMETWERAGLPMAFVVGNEPIKETQFTGMVRQHAPTRGKVTRDYPAAESWCLDGWRR